jgi:ribonuclease G
MFEKLINFFRPKKYRREIIVNVEKLETRVAVMEKGRLEEYMVEHPDDERLVGCIFRGRVQNLQDDLQAAFVDIGLKKNAFLHYWDMTPDCDAILEETDEEENTDPKNGGKKTSSPKSKRKPQRLSNEEIHKRYPEGSEITVMVTKGPISTKGPRVTTNLSIAGRYLVMMPGQTLRGVSKKVGDAQERQRLKKILDRLMIPDDVGVIARTASVGAKPKVIARDMRNLIESWRELQGNIKNLRVPCCVYREPGLVEQVVRDWLTEDIDAIVIDDKKTFEEMREVTSRISRRARNKIRLHEGAVDAFEQYGVERQLTDAFQRKVPLKSGGYLVIDETEALIAVDVNTGHYRTKDGKSKEKEGKNLQEEAILQVNLEAVEEVARQLRLRNIGGLVVLDLIDMKSRKHRKQVYQALKGFLKRDRARTNVQEISDLGLLEMSRQRKAESLLSMLSMPCPYCSGHGVVKTPLAVSIELQRKLRSLLRRADAEKKPFVPKIIVAPAVMQRLRTEDAQLLAELQSEFSTRLTFVSELHRHPESFSILDAEGGQVLYSSVTSQQHS